MAQTIAVNSKLTDAQILQFAMDTAQTDKEIKRVQRDVTKLRDQARQAANEARGLGGLVGNLRREGIRFGGGKIGIGNYATVGPRGFSLGGGFMRGAGGVLLIMQAASAGARAMTDAMDKYDDYKKKYGGEEAIARIAGEIGRKIAEQSVKRIYDVGTNFVTASIGLIGGATKAEREDYKHQAEMWFQTAIMDRFRTTMEVEERQERIMNAKVLISRAHHAYKDAEEAWVESWKPQNFQLRTSEDVRLLKQMMHWKNDTRVAEDVKKSEDEMRKKTKALDGED